MASPFRVFRRHQKVMIAVLCGMAMVAFVFAPLLLDMFGERVRKTPWRCGQPVSATSRRVSWAT